MTKGQAELLQFNKIVSVNGEVHFIHKIGSTFFYLFGDDNGEFYLTFGADKLIRFYNFEESQVLLNNLEKHVHEDN